ncbi:hypothetical protein ABZ468_24580 [Streptomyces sp. NPDC005708]|uniref:IS1634 family transposase n=1 Tax=Streptomyces sp. NPDC005708 TaxID=3154564 RepID=UPI0033D07726
MAQAGAPGLLPARGVAEGFGNAADLDVDAATGNSFAPLDGSPCFSWRPTASSLGAAFRVPSSLPESVPCFSLAPSTSPSIATVFLSGTPVAVCYPRWSGDAAKINAEENLDGKYLLPPSDPKMTTEDIALGYKQLLEVERGWRDMKQVIDLRPVFHRKEVRIRAHVLLCWLALLLAHIAETRTGQTWPTLRRELDRIKLGTFTGPAGTFQQRTEITKPQRDLLDALKLAPPPRIYQHAPASR